MGIVSYMQGLIIEYLKVDDILKEEYRESEEKSQDKTQRQSKYFRVGGERTGKLYFRKRSKDNHSQVMQIIQGAYQG